MLLSFYYPQYPKYIIECLFVMFLSLLYETERGYDSFRHYFPQHVSEQRSVLSNCQCHHQHEGAVLFENVRHTIRILSYNVTATV
jgi:hypothetical protein